MTMRLTSCASFSSTRTLIPAPSDWGELSACTETDLLSGCETRRVFEAFAGEPRRLDIPEGPLAKESISSNAGGMGNYNAVRLLKAFIQLILAISLLSAALDTRRRL